MYKYNYTLEKALTDIKKAKQLKDTDNKKRVRGCLKIISEKIHKEVAKGNYELIIQGADIFFISKETEKMCLKELEDLGFECFEAFAPSFPRCIISWKNPNEAYIPAEKSVLGFTAEEAYDFIQNHDLSDMKVWVLLSGYMRDIKASASHGHTSIEFKCWYDSCIFSEEDKAVREMARKTLIENGYKLKKRGPSLIVSWE